MIRALLAALVFCSLIACGKVPLREDFGDIDFVGADWYENEQVAYVFFSLAERTGRLINPQWQLQYTSTDSSGGAVLHPYAPIDFTKGVHLHQMTQCGSNRTCGSYSFRSAQPVTEMNLTFLYDAGSSLSLEKDIDTAQHSAGTTGDAYSAYVYGVFDSTNSHMQMLIHNNFASIDDPSVAQFGMTRQFHVSNVSLHDATTTVISSTTTSSGNNFLFPADLCTGSTGTGDLVFSGTNGWLNDTLDPTVGATGACFQAQFLDKTGATLLPTAAVGYGRRNPELTNPGVPILQTPLSTAVQLPIVVRICPTDPNAGAMVNQAFFNYQEVILGIPNRPTDLCFTIGQETQFATAFTALLASRLTAAKAAPSGTDDFVFVVVLHEEFTAEFTTIQAGIASALYTLINSESKAVSPRLVGAFVYGSSTTYQPNAKQSQVILWCPQKEASQVLSTTTPLADQNCTTTNAANFNLQIINFVAPLGPLPALSQYTSYVSSYGDAGVAKAPKLIFQSVPSGPNTVSLLSQQITYFDNERYTIGTGEAARMCPERADASLADFVILPPGQSTSVQGITAATIDTLWLSANAPGEYKIGIAWNFPFRGELDYQGAVNGKVASIIPYTKSFAQYQQLGDPQWETTSWNFGQYTQNCHRYCDNPFFDVGGTYQITGTWRTLNTSDNCPSPVYPQWPGGGS